MRRKLLFVGFLLALLPLQGNAARQWNFTAYLEDKPIGYHRFVLSEAGGEQQLVSEARFNVKFLFISAYQYVHDNRERWRGDCLATIDAATDDNGEDFRVRGQLMRDGFRVDNGQQQHTLPVCVMTFAYWNPDFLQQPRLLNAQNGDYLEVTVRNLGPDSITVRGQKRAAQRYQLEARGFQIELWYSPEREWLALDSVTESGKRLRYRLE